MISSPASSLMRKPFFPTTSRSFGTFYGHENRNIIHSFKVAKPWRSNNMLHSKEIPKCGHRLSFFISYSLDRSGSDDFPKFVVHGSNVEVKVSSAYKWIEPAKIICFRQMGAGSGDYYVKDGQKVKIHYKLYDYHSHEVRYSTYSEHDPEIVGSGKNKICQGLYEGIVGMRVGETRRVVLPPSSALTGKHSKNWSPPWEIMKWKPSSYSEEHRIYDVHLVDIIS